MKALYDKLSFEVSKTTTRLYSTSFSVGAYFLNSRIRNSIYSIYGFVRIADEIADSFGDYDRKCLLDRFEADTGDAIKERISINPILNSFQHVVHEYNISYELIDAFMRSMRMDLDQTCYTPENFKQYIFGSSEAVGLMCLQVFALGDMETYELLKPYAMRLGAAFQKVNFLRDIKHDYFALGRRYFPNLNITHFTEDLKKQIEDEIEDDFKVALTGIKMLPSSSKIGVYLAYVNFYSLFKKIKKMPASQILKQRVRISNGKKLSLIFITLLRLLVLSSFNGKEGLYYKAKVCSRKIATRLDNKSYKAKKSHLVPGGLQE
jgi:phytoene/squalene synthetase